MRAREIKRELEALGVASADAFEKDELVERLVQARLQATSPSSSSEAAGASQVQQQSSGPATPAVGEEVLTRCRAMHVTELRTELGQRGISWADALEKEELVQRLAAVLAEEAAFSASGRIRPGVVAQLSGTELELELQASSTPLLLDVYATWCGPCQMMAPHLESAARLLGARARVAKLDADDHSAMATRLRVGGLPTVIVFDRHGKEVSRQEGALMEQQLVKMVDGAAG